MVWPGPSGRPRRGARWPRHRGVRGRGRRWCSGAASRRHRPARSQRSRCSPGWTCLDVPRAWWWHRRRPAWTARVPWPTTCSWVMHSSCLMTMLGSPRSRNTRPLPWPLPPSTVRARSPRSSTYPSASPPSPPRARAPASSVQAAERPGERRSCGQPRARHHARDWWRCPPPPRAPGRPTAQQGTRRSTSAGLGGRWRACRCRRRAASLPILRALTRRLERSAERPILVLVEELGDVGRQLHGELVLDLAAA